MPVQYTAIRVRVSAPFSAVCTRKGAGVYVTALRIAPGPLPLASLVNTPGAGMITSATPFFVDPDTVERITTVAVPGVNPPGTTRLI